MAICYFSTSVKRANPSVLRFFAIDESRPVHDLLRCIAMIHGWDSDTKLNMSPKTEAKTIADMLKERADREIMPERVSESWLTLELEQIPEEEAALYGQIREGEQIRLLNWYGLNPVLKAESLRTWNLMQQEMMNERRGYISGLGFVEICNQVPDPEDLTLRMQQQIIEGRKPLIFNKSAGEYVAMILDEYRADDLKLLIRNLGLYTGGTMGKNRMVDLLEEHFDTPDFWSSILEEMPLAEYVQLKTMVFGTERAAYYSFPTLSYYGLNPGHMNYRPGSAVPTEFLDYFETVFQREDQSLMASKQAKEVLKVCIDLYGIFTMDQMRKVADKLLHTDCKDADLDKACLLNTDIEVLQDQVFYNKTIFTHNVAKNLYSNFKINHVPYFVPPREELQEWIEKGFHFSAAIEREMVNSIGNRYDSWKYGDKEDAVKAIYRCYHLNWDWSNIQKKLIREYGWGSSPKIYEKLKRIAEQVKDDVRLVELRGYTRNEYNRMRKEGGRR